VEFVGRINVVGQAQHGVLEGQQRARIDVEFDVQINGSAAAVFGVQVDFPGLAQRVRLYEMAFVVHVKAVGYCVIFEVCYETSYVNCGH
jgi:hypothetical protein